MRGRECVGTWGDWMRARACERQRKGRGVCRCVRTCERVCATILGLKSTQTADTRRTSAAAASALFARPRRPARPRRAAPEAIGAALGPAPAAGSRSTKRAPLPCRIPSTHPQGCPARAARLPDQREAHGRRRRRVGARSAVRCPCRAAFWLQGLPSVGVRPASARAESGGPNRGSHRARTRAHTHAPRARLHRRPQPAPAPGASGAPRGPPCPPSRHPRPRAPPGIPPQPTCTPAARRPLPPLSLAAGPRRRARAR
jgi:hypothetical protein